MAGRPGVLDARSAGAAAGATLAMARRSKGKRLTFGRGFPNDPGVLARIVRVFRSIAGVIRGDPRVIRGDPRVIRRENPNDPGGRLDKAKRGRGMLRLRRWSRNGEHS